MTRVVAWNIRAGGGTRANAVSEALAGWAPDVVVLSEARATPPTGAILSVLAGCGLEHQVSLASGSETARNVVAIASRWPLRRVGVRHEPLKAPTWVLARVLSPAPMVIGGMHIPNEVTGRKFPFMDAIASLAEGWRRGPALWLGDTNSGRPGIDEENAVFGPRYPVWFDRMERAGFSDLFRTIHPEAREFTWYSPNGRNGFRLDQAFANRSLASRVTGVRHEWVWRDGRRDAVSDHAALIVDFTDSSELG